MKNEDAEQARGERAELLEALESMGAKEAADKVRATEEVEVVVVYVRLPDDERRDAREIRFRVPDNISQAELLRNGFAIDGNSATQAVVPFGDRQLSDLLRERQMELVEWFDEFGYEVEFK